jgi:DNA-binding Lrp family transcriptional regulator
MDFSREETLVLNRVQIGIPCASEPFRVIADEIGLTEDEVLEIIVRLKKNNIIRNISGIFNGKKLGYFLSLVAFEVPVIKQMPLQVYKLSPGCSHNYLRNHRYISGLPWLKRVRMILTEQVETLAAKAGASDYLVLKNEQLLKIGCFS